MLLMPITVGLKSEHCSKNGYNGYVRLVTLQGVLRTNRAGDRAFFIAGFQSLAFIVRTFAAADSNTAFYVAAAGQDFQRDDGLALLLRLYEGLDFTAFGQ